MIIGETTPSEEYVLEMSWNEIIVANYYYVDVTLNETMARKLVRRESQEY